MCVMFCFFLIQPYAFDLLKTLIYLDHPHSPKAAVQCPDDPQVYLLILQECVAIKASSVSDSAFTIVKTELSCSPGEGYILR